MDSSFIFVWILQTSHCTANMYSNPLKKANDGLFTVYLVRDITRYEMLQLLIQMDTGDHINHPKVEAFQCTAYRIEPLDERGEVCSSGGMYTLDGECVEYGPIQGEMCVCM